LPNQLRKGTEDGHKTPENDSAITVPLGLLQYARVTAERYQCKLLCYIVIYSATIKHC